MEPTVIGGGYFFLAAGCGPALSQEERKFLPTIVPSDWYPLAGLLDLFKRAEKFDPNLVYGTGRRWGSALKVEFEKMGINSIEAAHQELPRIYRRHHQGEIGTLSATPTSTTSALIIYDGPYPYRLITGAYEAATLAYGGEDVTTTPLEQPAHYHLAWHFGG